MLRRLWWCSVSCEKNQYTVNWFSHSSIPFKVSFSFRLRFSHFHSNSNVFSSFTFILSLLKDTQFVSIRYDTHPWVVWQKRPSNILWSIQNREKRAFQMSQYKNKIKFSSAEMLFILAIILWREMRKEWEKREINSFLFFIIFNERLYRIKK